MSDKKLFDDSLAVEFGQYYGKRQAQLHPLTLKFIQSMDGGWEHFRLICERDFWRDKYLKRK